MKKLVYLLSLVLVATLISCEEEDVMPKNIAGVDDGIITLEQLCSNTWYMQYYIYDGENWRTNSSDNDKPFPEGMKEAFADWEFYVEDMIAYELPRSGDVLYIQHSFTKEGDIIKVGGYQYTIVGYTPNPDNILQMRLDKTPNPYDYLGGIMEFSY